ncbi:DNA-binding response regulator [Capsulimonas corticalis]|uniref:DNA-binding response regulator n=1 Tax=Capsulimonas corticalis TaxID=2219043 RepID=A0A402CRE5_9BACT|nr:response regulator transcription factor [Capsulimonas corticalis]BDI28069.1 DNA-binding response regulator [Capsulimonas corticalis]
MAGKIMIVEDDRAIAQSLSRLLAREEYYIVAKSTAEEGIAQIREDPSFDLALLDVTLPGRDGFFCCREIRQLGWRGPVIMLTGRSLSIEKVAGLEAGADDYLTKPFDPAELLARIRAHLRRTRDYNAPDDQQDQIAVDADLIVDLRIRDAVVQGAPVHLTDREFELLLLLARSLGTAQDKIWLFQQIWGCSPEMGIKALAVYIRRLRQKIEVNADEPRYIQTVRGFGYRLGGE